MHEASTQLESIAHAPPLELATLGDSWHASDDDGLSRAIQIGATGNFARRLLYTLGQALRFLISPGHMLPFLVVRMVTAMEVARAPIKLARFHASADGLALLATKPQLSKAGLERLLDLPADTLGGAYARFAFARNLDPQFVVQPDYLDEDTAYVHQRTSETHDLWHVLLGFETNLMAEAAQSSFIAAQYGGAFLHLLMVLSMLAVLGRKPWLVPEVFRTYQRGRAAAPLLAVRWERLWGRSLDEVRRELGIVVQTHPELALRVGAD